MRLLLATRNDHKLREFRRLLARTTLDPLPGDVDTPPETGGTYAENALIKARAAAAATGMAAFADDSGIESEALDDAPGVRTARYAGPDATDAENLARFVAEVPRGSRLRYVCVIALVGPDGAEHLFEGACEGTMAEAPAGAGGFGYDPIFVPDDVPRDGAAPRGGAAPRDGAAPRGAAPPRTMAELSDAEKDAISHRGRAARALEAWLAR